MQFFIINAMQFAKREEREKNNHKKRQAAKVAVEFEKQFVLILNSPLAFCALLTRRQNKNKPVRLIYQKKSAAVGF
jgi:C4-type Zn-finger protein